MQAGETLPAGIEVIRAFCFANNQRLDVVRFGGEQMPFYMPLSAESTFLGP
jgi:hypothetical protein